jgi:hypothetical protein
LDTEEEFCACFIDWEKAFDWVKWTKLMQILRGTCIKWQERRLICKLYMDQKCYSTTGPRRDKKLDDWERSQRRMLFVTDLFNLYSEYLTSKAPEGFGDSK